MRKFVRNVLMNIHKYVAQSSESVKMIIDYLKLIECIEYQYKNTLWYFTSKKAVTIYNPFDDIFELGSRI